MGGTERPDPRDLASRLPGRMLGPLERADWYLDLPSISTDRSSTRSTRASRTRAGIETPRWPASIRFSQSAE